MPSTDDINGSSNSDEFLEYRKYDKEIVILVVRILIVIRIILIYHYSKYSNNSYIGNLENTRIILNQKYSYFMN